MLVPSGNIKCYRPQHAFFRAIVSMLIGPRVHIGRMGSLTYLQSGLNWTPGPRHLDTIRYT